MNQERFDNAANDVSERAVHALVSLLIRRGIGTRRVRIVLEAVDTEERTWTQEFSWRPGLQVRKEAVNNVFPETEWIRRLDVRCVSRLDTERSR
jgi:hypothetical protein